MGHQYVRGALTPRQSRDRRRGQGLRNRGEESSSPSGVHVASLKPHTNTTSVGSDRHVTEWADVQRQHRVDGTHDA